MTSLVMAVIKHFGDLWHNQLAMVERFRKPTTHNQLWQWLKVFGDPWHNQLGRWSTILETYDITSRQWLNIFEDLWRNQLWQWLNAFGDLWDNQLWQWWEEGRGQPVLGVRRGPCALSTARRMGLRMVGRLHAHSSFLHQSSAASWCLAVVSNLQPAFLSLIGVSCLGLCIPAATTDGRFVPQCKLSLRLVFAAAVHSCSEGAVHNLQACDATAAVKGLYTTYRPVTPQLQWRGCTQPTGLWRHSCGCAKPTGLWRHSCSEADVHNLQACTQPTAAVKWLYTTYWPMMPQLQWSGCTQPVRLWRYQLLWLYYLLSTTHDAGVVLQYQTFHCSGSAHFWRSLNEHQRAQESPHVLHHVCQTLPQFVLAFQRQQFQHGSEWQVMARFRGLVSLTGLSTLPDSALSVRHPRDSWLLHTCRGLLYTARGLVRG